MVRVQNEGEFGGDRDSDRQESACISLAESFCVDV